MSAFNRLNAIALLTALAAVSACDDSRSVAVPTSPMGVAPGAVSAYIAASNTNPAPGSNVTLSVRALRGAGVAAIGSYTIRLGYDSTRLRFVESPRSAKGMVMANPAKRGLVVAAGAAAEGFTDDVLFTATFTVLQSNALRSLELNVSELNSIAFQDQRANTYVSRGLYRAAPQR